MSRDNIVSVRLTDAELADLKRRGKPTDILRSLLHQSPPRSVVVPINTASIAPGYCVIWHDGTAGPNWPAR